MNNVICRSRFPLKPFTYSAFENSLTVEASTLGLKPGSEPFSQVWNDSVDIGMVVKSHYTNKECIFTFQDYIRQDMDVVGWKFNSYNLSGDKPLELIVWNT